MGIQHKPPSKYGPTMEGKTHLTDDTVFVQSKTTPLTDGGQRKMYSQAVNVLFNQMHQAFQGESRGSYHQRIQTTERYERSWLH